MKINWSTLTGPTLLIHKGRAQRNIATMQAKAQSAGVSLRPHFKTHQSPIIGKWFGPADSTPIAVSSLAMAQQFADAGWQDIHLAIPINPRELPALNSLASRVTLTITIEHEDAIELLERMNAPFRLMIEVDTGYGRTGISWQQHARIRRMLDAAQALTQAQRLGLMVHSGHSYKSHDDAGIQAVHHESSSRLKELLDTMQWPGGLWISVGDTPTCSRMDRFPGAHEIRPGNYVFYDLQQRLIGSCDWQDIAAAVACPVIARYPERGEVVVHGGAVHFSKDFALVGERPVYGQVMNKTDRGWGAPLGQGELIGLSQEHGKVALPANMIRELKLGDMLVIVPAHSCLTMAALREFIVFDD
ncbi:MAG: alanine racemase [Idiomarina sp.]|nr:alanine racemase [Idiomarina sp.]